MPKSTENPPKPLSGVCDYLELEFEDVGARTAPAHAVGSDFNEATAECGEHLQDQLHQSLATDLPVTLIRGLGGTHEEGITLLLTTPALHLRAIQRS